MKLSVVIPAKNEEKRIREFLLEICLELDNNNLSQSSEILIIVNNSNDNTIEVIKGVQTQYPNVSYLDVPHAIGKGGAVALGFKKARGEYIAFIDADGSSSAKELMNLFKLLSSEDRLDLVIASRYFPGSRIIGELPWSRKLYSRIINLITRVVFGLTYFDTQCGLKVCMAIWNQW